MNDLDTNALLMPWAGFGEPAVRKRLSLDDATAERLFGLRARSGSWH